MYQVLITNNKHIKLILLGSLYQGNSYATRTQQEALQEVDNSGYATLGERVETRPPTDAEIIAWAESTPPPSTTSTTTTSTAGGILRVGGPGDTVFGKCDEV